MSGDLWESGMRYGEREGRKERKRPGQISGDHWLLILISTCELKFKRMKRKHPLRALPLIKPDNFLANSYS